MADDSFHYFNNSSAKFEQAGAVSRLPILADTDSLMDIPETERQLNEEIALAIEQEVQSNPFGDEIVIHSDEGHSNASPFRVPAFVSQAEQELQSQQNSPF